ncbi:hypothetical protein BJX61DRAFT_360392 [Aspergillus egyptiacus]|nr:hypothetical protein BJX61DRAFT_360392 [Aspergillus egyptiacus]
MLVLPMPPQGSSLPLSQPSSNAEAPASHTIMSPAIPSQTSSISHPSMSCGLNSNATSRPALSRPKLTLQTTSLPMSFGTSSTGLSLSLAAGATASPTVRNTFKNAYDIAYPSSATASPSKTSSNRFSKPSSPYTSGSYQLPLGVKSILRNSPLESNKRRSSSVAPGGSTSSRRVYFPPKKQVSYRYPLEEEITNVKYTARHSDLVSESESGSCDSSSEDDSDSTSSSLSSEITPSDDDTGTESSSDLTLEKKKKRKYRSAERQVRAIALMEGLEDPYSHTPQTPRQGRLKRRREWKWTLGPLDEIGKVEPTPLLASVSETPPASTHTLETAKELNTTASASVQTSSPNQ